MSNLQTQSGVESPNAPFDQPRPNWYLAPMKNALLIALFLASAPAFADAPQNCAQAWEKGFPIAKFKTSYPCYLHAEIPGAMGTTRIYYAEEFRSGEGPTAELLPVLERIRQAVIDTAPVYLPFGKSFPTDIIYTGLASSKGVNAEVPFTHHEYPEPVPMVVYRNILTESTEYQKQTIAHELFHVFQATRFANAAALPEAKWWVEGSADFFSNLVYPRTNREHNFAEAYDGDADLFSQSPHYATNAFFQSFALGWMGAEGVVSFLNSMPKTEGDLKAQWSAVSRYPSMSLHFGDFARRFTLSRVEDTGGGFVPTHYVDPVPTEVAKEGLKETVTPEPFLIRTRKYRLPSGYKWKLSGQSLSTESPEASYRRIGKDSDWQQLFTGYPVSLDTSCSSKPKEIDVLLTSTAGPDAEKLSYEVSLESEKIECHCKPTGDVAKGILGYWRLRESSMKDFLQQALNVGGTIESVSGEMLLTITADHGFKFELKGATADAATPDGIRIRVEANGVGTLATVQAPGTDRMCLTDASADAVAKITVEFPGHGSSSSNTTIQEMFDEGADYRLDVKAEVLTVYRELPGAGEVSLVFDRQYP